jgi:adenine-specific DNA-methyltransferase
MSGDGGPAQVRQGETIPLPGFKGSAPSSSARADDTLRPALGRLKVASAWRPTADAILYEGPCESLLSDIPDGAVQLVVTSPPYNIGKSYERRTSLEAYVEEQRAVIAEAVRVVSDHGSICWQVGNHISKSEVFPLDAVLYPVFKSFDLRLRNRIVWAFDHGLHARKRLSGRHETILWFTKGDPYAFDLDPIRVPQKYPNKKAFKGPNAGTLTGNPLGKNPGDVWRIPNVKANHIEKTQHPCQFPVELVERLVLSLTSPGDWVLDPYGGVGSSVVAAVLNGRRGGMAEILPDYVWVARQRLRMAERGQLRTRPMTRPIFEPR